MKYTAIVLALLAITLASAISAQDWHTDIEIAKATAAAESKTILVSFQGSDWCAPCIKLEKKIWHSEEFKTYALDNFVLVKVDFPRRKKNKLSKELQDHNAMLAETYNTQGIFPLVVLLDSTGEVIAETGYKKIEAQEYVDHLQELLGS